MVHWMKDTFYRLVATILIAISFGCGDTQSNVDPKSPKGGIAFSIIWPSDLKNQGPNAIYAAASINCENTGVATVSAEVYGTNKTLVASGSWPCNQGQGTLDGIAPRTNLQVVISAKNNDGETLLRGTKADVAVLAGQTTSLGAIALDTINTNPPIVLIDNPHSDAVFELADEVSFEGSADDLEDGLLANTALSWSSDLDGSIGTGSPLTISALSVGSHTITLSAIDSDWNTGSTTISVSINSTGNLAPEVSINNPSTQAVYSEGVAVTFEGNADDPEDGPIPAESLAWSSSLDGELGSGDTISTDSLSVGIHVISLVATDQNGAKTAANITLQVNGKPIVAIQSPPVNNLYNPGENISFNGSGSDPEEGTLSGADLIWVSDIDGQVGSGTSFVYSGLSTGTHEISLTASDNRGATSTALRTVIINTPPTATISNPKKDDVFQQGQEISFAGTGSDPEDGALGGEALVWVSDFDGQIGTGTSFIHSGLSAGQHEISLTATDTNGASSFFKVPLFINTAPNIAITSPQNGHQRCIGLPVQFNATAVDPEDGDISQGGTLRWSSDRDGQIGTASSFSTISLSQGTHTISLSATDSMAGVATTSMQVVVHPPRLSDTGQTVSATSRPGEDSDYTSHQPSFTNNGDGTVTDNLTGLLWQQSDDGVARPYYIARYEYAGTVSIGGYSNWRLPTKKELLRIANFGQENAAIDTTIFPATKNMCYWTQVSCTGQAEHVWAVDFTTGSVSATPDSTSCYVRLVHGDINTEPADLVNNGDGTVTDRKTGLMWLDGEGECCSSWTGSLSYCEGLTLAGHTDWRLPNIKELESIADDSRYDPAIDTTFFNSTLSGGYWSSTVRSSNTHFGWKVNFKDGLINHYSAEEEPNVARCVRGGN